MKRGMICALFLLMSTVAFGQKPRTRQPASKAAMSRTRGVCRGEPVPKGFVVVGYKSSERCGQNSELSIKKPADTETVCDGSPIPEGYHVVSQETSTACAPTDSNPLANALSIVKDQPSATSLQTGPTRAGTARLPGDSDDGSSLRRAKQRNSVNSIVQERADRQNAEASLYLAERAKEEAMDKAIKNHRVLVGMTFNQVLQAVGRPNRLTRDTTGNGQYEIWFYDTQGGGYGAVHFQEGVVVLVGARP